MTEGKGWTPGPWEMLERGGPITSKVEAELSEDWKFVVQVPCPPFAFGRTAIAVCGDDWQESEAISHLIAAAPELYEALEELVRVQMDGDWEYWQGARRRAEAALAKARGEQS